MWNTFVAFALGLFSQPLLKWIDRFLFAPRLNIRFGTGEDFVSKNPLFDENTGQQLGEGYYIRIKVKNSRYRPAKNCKGFLAKIEQKVADQWQAASYYDVIPLGWTHGKIQSLDLLYGIDYPLDIFRTQNGSPAFYPCFGWQPFRYLGGFGEKTSYRLTIQLAAEETNPAEISLIVNWNGSWDDFRVREEDRPRGGWFWFVPRLQEPMRRARGFSEAIQTYIRRLLDGSALSGNRSKRKKKIANNS